MSKLWKDVFKEFKESTGIDTEKISDYRPCYGPYASGIINEKSQCIIVWLEDGSTIIYISKETAL